MASDARDNPFQILGLEPSLRLKPSEIDRAYLDRIATAHPDANPDADPAVDSATLHAAKQTLKDPERRANALLAHLGGPSSEANKALPTTFLVEIMETREQVEAELAQNAEAARERWGAWADAERARYIDTLAPLFDRAADPTGDPADNAGVRDQIRIQLNAWRYVERLAEQLDPDYDPARADFNS